MANSRKPVRELFCIISFQHYPSTISAQRNHFLMHTMICVALVLESISFECIILFAQLLRSAIECKVIALIRNHVHYLFFSWFLQLIRFFFRINIGIKGISINGDIKLIAVGTAKQLSFVIKKK